jgi:hypothetical protein
MYYTFDDILSGVIFILQNGSEVCVARCTRPRDLHNNSGKYNLYTNMIIIYYQISTYESRRAIKLIDTTQSTYKALQNRLHNTLTLYSTVWACVRCATEIKLGDSVYLNKDAKS